jgi:membrane protease YdiL (CAAX protease family)
MLLFLGLNLLVAVLPLGAMRLLATGVASLLSLTVLAWPVWRGIPWEQVRQDIGWTGGRLGALEAVFGPICYILSIPLLLIGVVMVLVLASSWNMITGGGPPGEGLAPQGPPAHPIVDVVARAGWWGWVQVFFLAAIVAPIVEETMFRGVLYRQVREATGGLGLVISVVMGGTLVSFIFAAIHPQGLLAVPALMALAYGFTIAREWRDTLLPSIIAHGINNGLVMLILLLILAN